MASEIVRVNDLHAVLNKMPEEVSMNIRNMRTKAQQSHNLKTKVVLHTFHVGNYVIMHLADSQHGKVNT